MKQITYVKILNNIKKMNKSDTERHIKNSNNSELNIAKSMRFLQYLELFLANAKTKRVRGYGTVG